MSNLTDQDYRDILNVLYLLNCCKNIESFLDTLILSIIRMFCAECVTFHLVKGYPQQIKMVEARSFRANGNNLIEDKIFPAVYRAGMYQQSPLLKEAQSSTRATLITGESISLKDWEESDFYNNLIRPQNLYKELFVPLRWKNQLTGMFTIWRSRNQPDYQTRDISRAEALAPHIPVIIRNVSVAAKITCLQKDLMSIEETDRQGILLLDHRLKPVYFNKVAKRICERLNSCTLRGSEGPGEDEFLIPDSIVNECVELFRRLKAASYSFYWPKDRIVISENDLRFRVETSIIRVPDHTSYQSIYLVNLTEMRNYNDPITDLRVRFNLSKRELDIVFLMVKGLTYGEIAENLFISKLTVHTHVKNLYRKLRTKNRAELYRFIQAPNFSD